MKEKKLRSESSRQQTGEIDWEDVRRRVGLAQKELEGGFAVKPAEKKRILRERAKALAREEDREKAGGEYLEVLEFLLGYEKYGIESAFVSEVHKMTELTPLPCTPLFVMGIISLRGRIISVIDLKKLFELPEKGLTDLDKVLVVRNQEMEFGILADAVIGIRRIPFSELQPSLPTLTGIREEYLKGVTGERLVVLDADRLLADNKIVVQEKVEN